MKRKIILLILAGLMLVTSACSQAPEPQGEDDNRQQEISSTEEMTAEEDKLSQYNFDGKEIRILTSINVSENIVGSNSNYMIEGTGEINGESVNDAVYKRNMDVEDLLGVKFKYTAIDEDYDTIETSISKLMLAGVDEYDLIINDIRSLANLSLQGMFLNVKETDVFELSESYWYTDYMDDVSIGNEKSFLLAGDYFADILRNCHALFLNKSMLEEQMQGETEKLYQTIINGNWTFDEFLSLIKGFLKDLNGDGSLDKEDQYGFICVRTWGSAIPFMMAADTGVFTKDAGGIPELTINNPKSIQLHDYLTTLFKTDSGGNPAFEIDELVPAFQNRKSLIVGYQRLRTLEVLRSMTDEIAVLPYPKLNSEQAKYITSSHDIVEVGAIPTTSPNFDMTCVVLEALNRETKKTIIPVYYEEALKVKYARDEASAQIIDIIHDSMGNVFPLAYSQSISEVLTLYDVTATPNFTSGYEKRESQIQKKLEKVIEEYLNS